MLDIVRYQRKNRSTRLNAEIKYKTFSDSNSPKHRKVQISGITKPLIRTFEREKNM